MGDAMVKLAMSAVARKAAVLFFIVIAVSLGLGMSWTQPFPSMQMLIGTAGAILAIEKI